MTATYDLVLRGGTVIDGSGRPGRHGDVAVRDGRIVSVGPVDGRGMREVDVDGLVVAPGVIDIHTHYDAQLFWDGAATPSSLHGVTTVIGGNCGFSIAPLEPGQEDYLAAMLARVEGIPLTSLQRGVPWDWRSFADYLGRFDGRVAVNAGFLVGHTTLRRCVMGADDEHPAVGQALIRMEGLLRATLEGGALGLSSSTASTHNDASGRAVSSRYADRAELLHLSQVTGEYEGTTLEFIPSVEAYFDNEVMDLMTAMSLAADRPINWNILNVNTLLWDGSRQRLTAGDYAAERGGRVIALTMPISSTLRVTFESGFVLDSLPGWAPLFELPLEQRQQALGDREQRKRMRQGVDDGDTTLVRRVRDWGALIVEQTFSPETAMFSGRRLDDIAGSGQEPFDTLLDIVIADGLRTVIVLPPVGNDPESWELRRQVWADDRAVIGGSDSGAHLDMIDTFVYATALLGPITRDGHVRLEEAARLLSDVPARLYGLRGRGQVGPGYQADMIVFDPEKIGPGPIRTVADLPGSASRLFADATGIEHVFVNGTETVRHGALTGATPGVVLRSGRDTETVHPKDLPMVGSHRR